MNEPESSSGFRLRRYVRVELLSTVALVFLALFTYAYFFLDDHLEWAVESLGSRALGAEVNLADLETGWVEPRIVLSGLQVTNPSAPSRNWFELDRFDLQLSTPALLRAKLLVEHARVQTLRFNTERSSPGWVSEEGGDLRWVYNYTREFLASSLESSTSGTFLEDVLSILGGASPEEQLESLRQELQTPQRLTDFKTDLNQRRESLRERVESLPGKRELAQIRQQLKELQSDEKDPLKWAQKLKRLRDIRERLSDLREQIKRVRSELTDVVSSYRERLADLQGSLQSDLQVISKRFSLPALTLENPSQKLFQSFLEQRAGSLNSILDRVRPYLGSVRIPGTSPGGTPGSQPGEPDRLIGSRDYQFVTPRSYPDYWLQEFTITTEETGRKIDSLRARAVNLTSHPKLVDQPLNLEFDVALRESFFGRVAGQLTREQGGGKSSLQYRAELTDMNIRNWLLVEGTNLTLRLVEGIGRLNIQGVLEPAGLTTDVNFRVEAPAFSVDSENQRLRSTLQQLVAGLDELRVNAHGTGTPGNLQWSVRSNLGEALSSGLQSLVRGQVQATEREVRRKYKSQIQARYRELQQSLGSLEEGLLGRLQERSGLIDELNQRIRDMIEQNTGSDSDKKNPAGALKDLFSSRK